MALATFSLSEKVIKALDKVTKKKTPKPSKSFYVEKAIWEKIERESK